MARLRGLDPLVTRALHTLAHAYADGQLAQAEYARRVGLIEGWLRARGHLHPVHGPLLDTSRLWRPSVQPRPPVAAQLSR